MYALRSSLCSVYFYAFLVPNIRSGFGGQSLIVQVIGGGGGGSIKRTKEKLG